MRGRQGTGGSLAGGDRLPCSRGPPGNTKRFRELSPLSILLVAAVYALKALARYSSGPVSPALRGRSARGALLCSIHRQADILSVYAEPRGVRAPSPTIVD